MTTMATERISRLNAFRWILIAFTLFYFSPPLHAGGLLWIGAHPDDEGAVAAVMAKFCTTSGEAGKVPCRMLVMTKGGGGDCHGLPDPGQCADPNKVQKVKAVRSQEMQNAALYLHSSLIQWDLTNAPSSSPTEVINRWSAQVGSQAALIDLIQLEILNFLPDRILTFDPRHGVTCHNDHRAIGALVTAAADEMNYPTAWVLYSENGTDYELGSDGQPIWLGNKALVPSDSAIFSEDVSVFLPNYNLTAWKTAIEAARFHQSQLGEPELQGLSLFGNAPATAQKVFFLQRSHVNFATPDSRYEACSN